MDDLGMSDETAAHRTIIEAWWHRLLKVILGFFVVLAVVISALLASEHSWTYTRYYSWHASGIPAELLPASTKCEITLYSDAVGTISGCGDFYRPEQLIEDLIAQGKLNRRQYYGGAWRPARYTATDAYQLAQTYDYRAAGRQEFSATLAKEAAVWVVMTLLLASVVAYAIYRGALYIVHGGGTKIVRR